MLKFLIPIKFIIKSNGSIRVFLIMVLTLRTIIFSLTTEIVELVFQKPLTKLVFMIDIR